MKNVIGHKEVKYKLERNSRSKIILLHGMRGIGKATLAKEWAKIISENNPSSILDISNKNITTDDMRKIQYFLSLASRKKVVMINSFNLINENAANCLLKTLEEPSNGSHIIITTENIYTLPKAFVFRCLSIHMHPLTKEETIQVLHNNGFKIEDVFELYGSPGTLMKEGVFDLYHNIKKANKDTNLVTILIETDLEYDEILYVINRIILQNISDCNELNEICDAFSKIQKLTFDAKNLNLGREHSLILIAEILKKIRQFSSR